MCKLSQSFDDSLDYREMLQVDGAFAVSHINCGKLLITSIRKLESGMRSLIRVPLR